MKFIDLPIRKKLMAIIMLISGAVLLLTCVAFFAYEFYTFRQTMVQQLSTLAQITATNSTAALAFNSPGDATEILNALQAEKHIVAVGLYDIDDNLFSKYPANLAVEAFPAVPGAEGYQFKKYYLEIFQPVVQGNRRLGTLYLKSDLGAMDDRFQLYGIIVVLIIIFSSLLAFLLSKIMQKRVSRPILSLAETAKAISNHGDYSMRVTKSGKDELGVLTDAFNRMLMQIEEQNQTLNSFNQKLGQKVMELQKTNADLDNFIYTASHDLKAPISNIEGLIFALNEELKDKNEIVQEMLGMIELSIQKFKTTILDLTDIAKIQKQIETEVDQVNIAALLDDILVNIKNIIDSNDAVINIELTSCTEIKFSRKNMRSILYNLISNAIKYRSPDRKPVVTIKTEQVNDYCLISVKDNGLGLDSKQKDKVFVMFKRFHDHVEGTGIGLYIVKRIVENAGGRVEVESEKGNGSTFKVYLKTK